MLKKITDKIYKNGLFIVLIGLGILFYIVKLLGSQDNDMYFEIVSGNDLLNGNFSTATHLGNIPIIVQQWLYAVCMAIFDKLGYIGDILFVLVQNIILWVVSSIFIYQKTNDKKKAILGSFFATIYCYNYMINIRPQIITVILIIVELLFVEHYKKTKDIIWLIPSIPILCLASNFHQAVFLYHLFVLIPYYIDTKTIDEQTKISIDWKLVFMSIIYVACSLVTPYGIDGALYIVRTFQSKALDTTAIMEVASLSIKSFIGVKLLILVSIVIWNIYKHKSNRFVNFYTFSIFILALVSARHISILFIAVMFIICYIDFSELSNNYVYGIICFLLINLCLTYSTHIRNYSDNFGIIGEIIKDKDAKIYNSAMELGGWFEYCGYTNVKFDARPELFSEEMCGEPNLLQDYRTMILGTKYDNEQKATILADDEYILSIVEDYDYVVIKTNSYFNRIANKQWHSIYSSNLYVVWENDKFIECQQENSEPLGS